MNVAVIPARGGSKRIPGKNVRQFAGQPLIAYAIRLAVASGIFDRIIVSTDDASIARTSRALGAEVPFMRPASLADDFTGTTQVIAHAVQWLEKHGTDANAVCCIYPAAPFTDRADIIAARSILDQGWDYVLAATEFAAPVERAFRRTPEGGITMLNPARFDTRSQDLEPTYHDAGQFYWGQARAWKEQRVLFGERTHTLLIPRWRAHDIDTEDDWLRAELIYAALITGSAEAGRSDRDL